MCTCVHALLLGMLTRICLNMQGSVEFDEFGVRKQTSLILLQYRNGMWQLVNIYIIVDSYPY